ncbi:uncharacterized protein A4U43_C07F16590 [Asparagus officinalis]|uniref:Myb/SANT-like DNA-binding domain-containing protein n=1 Tax=Asparagus officinalis TaxID=4686 RepID=A0A5P1EEG5_ASPOF|nr:trihelix transcription factor ASIL1 [Asparagus officinalis]ONK63567.1 uncharacterized protein A4U43_C07F16590 [Asparagus officinalis]
MEGQPKEQQLEETASAAPLPPRLNPKRDEWSEGAVTCLLEAYEAKWVLRNRAKLKGQDWEDVARQVSARAESGSSRSTKTATQCKNKVESMKKRYRNEVAAAGRGSGSRWPLFSKLDGLVRCQSGSRALVVADDKIASCDQGAEEEEAATAVQEEYTEGDKEQPPEMNKEPDQKVQSCNSSKETQHIQRKREKRKRTKEEGCEVAESIRWLTDAILRVEQMRMESMRDMEKIRAETEAKKAEMELKRTEILANTQLQIAKLFAKKSNGDKANFLA